MTQDAAKAGMIHDWPQLRDFALSLGLPEVTLSHPWGHEALKAHGKLWCYWSFYEDAAVFKADRDEREMLMAADPETFFLHPHYANHPLVLVRGGGGSTPTGRARGWSGNGATRPRSAGSRRGRQGNDGHSPDHGPHP